MARSDSEKLNDIREYLKQNDESIANGEISAIGVVMAIELLLEL